MRGAGPRSTERVDLTDHHLVEIPLRGRDGELLALDLWGRGAVGIEERPDALVAAFTSAPAATAAAADFHGEHRTVADTAGLDSWRGPAFVVHVDPFVIHPPWLDSPAGPAADSVVLSIDPGRSFGSGSHASTRLALRLLAGAVWPGARVADIGCGSGVLAVASARLGATAVAADTDPAAVAASHANAVANGVADLVDVRLGSATDLAPEFDIVAVNVTVDIHEQLGAAVRALAPTVIVASGMLEHQRTRVHAAYRGTETARETDGEWVGLRLDL